MLRLGAFALPLVGFALSSPIIKRDELKSWTSISGGDIVFKLGNVSYLGLTSTPAAKSKDDILGDPIPFTVVKTTECDITSEVVESTIAKYLSSDDVYAEGFLEGLYISSTCEGGAKLHASASDFVKSTGCSKLLVDPAIEVTDGAATTVEGLSTLEPGPYVAKIAGGSASFSLAYRLYQDRYRTFVFGAYPNLDVEGSFKALPDVLTDYQDPLIPVPSRIYSWSDTRPFAGLRIGVKDLYDVQGLQTAGGSRAWAEYNPIAAATAPSIQRIIDLGGQVVGKQKTAQFASGADPWGWFDVQYPFNPRGDGWLTCSASSSGGGCSIAAYDWLDNTIGSDTGSSMRRPASVSGTYGNRPSQGMMSLENVQPLGAAQDTAGVFSRDPYQFAYFGKHWYVPELHQDASINGLAPMSAPDNYSLPKTVYYDPGYLPVRNEAADALVQQFYESLQTVIGMNKVDVNLSEIVINHPEPAVYNTTFRGAASSLLNTRTQWLSVGEPLLTWYAETYDGRLPPIDPARRPGWIARTPERFTDEDYADALEIKRSFADWMNEDFLGYSDETCSDAIWIYDVGTGGLPSYREEPLLVNNTAATRLNYSPPNTVTNGVSYCSFAGCVDVTIPIGQVPYFSNVTQVEEQVPVAVNLVARRGCDFVIFDLITALADAGVLKVSRSPVYPTTLSNKTRRPSRPAAKPSSRRYTEPGSFNIGAMMT